MLCIDLTLTAGKPTVFDYTGEGFTTQKVGSERLQSKLKPPMSIRLEELPLFPLHAVLLPYQTLPVQVFEDRYREMIQGCANLDQPFRSESVV